MVLAAQRIDLALGADDGFTAAKRIADEAASSLLAEPICLAWVDAESHRESPAHAECHGDGETPGAVEYARNRGAELEVVVGGGRYIFCYRSAGEFAGA